MPTIPRTTEGTAAVLAARRALDRLMRATGYETDRIIADLFEAVRELPPELVVDALRAASLDLTRDLTERVAEGIRRAAVNGSESSALMLAQATGIETIPGGGVAERIADQLIARGGKHGLPLSQRLHRMTLTYRVELDKAVAQGIRAGDGAFTLARRLAKQAQAGIVPEPALVQEARALISQMGMAGGPAARRAAAQLAHEVGRYAQTLVGEARLLTGTMRPAWEELAKRIERAATTGRQDVLDKAVEWWVRDKESYQAQVIARTEMADAATRAYEERARESGLVKLLTWHIADETACDECKALDGDEFTFDSGHERPPLHPNCRCRTGLVIDRAAALDRIVSRALEGVAA